MQKKIHSSGNKKKAKFEACKIQVCKIDPYKIQGENNNINKLHNL